MLATQTELMSMLTILVKPALCSSTDSCELPHPNLQIGSVSFQDETPGLRTPGECVDALGVFEELDLEGEECLEALPATHILAHAHTLKSIASARHKRFELYI